jgi:hypothetical protein
MRGWEAYSDKTQYAAGYPEQPQDIFLEEGYRVGADGTFERDDADNFVATGSGILIRWDEVQFLEFFPEAAE